LTAPDRRVLLRPVPPDDASPEAKDAAQEATVELVGTWDRLIVLREPEGLSMAGQEAMREVLHDAFRERMLNETILVLPFGWGFEVVEAEEAT
jgi:hypothetical protein